MKLLITFLLLQISFTKTLKKEEKKDKDTKRKLDDEEVEKYIKSLYHRAYSINDKIDHLLFHHNHDLTGKKAQFTPFGIHFLPRYKGADSVDQKLKMVDYMHSMGGFHPAGGFMTPYLFAHSIEEEKRQQEAENGDQQDESTKSNQDDEDKEEERLLL